MRPTICSLGRTSGPGKPCQRVGCALHACTLALLWSGRACAARLFLYPFVSTCHVPPLHPTPEGPRPRPPLLYASPPRKTRLGSSKQAVREATRACGVVRLRLALFATPPPPPKMGHGTTHFSGAVEEAAAQLGLHLIHVFFASLLYNTVSYIPSSSHPSTATAAAVPPLNLFPILSSSTLSPLLRASHGGKRYS